MDYKTFKAAWAIANQLTENDNIDLLARVFYNDQIAEDYGKYREAVMFLKSYPVRAVCSESLEGWMIQEKLGKNGLELWDEMSAIIKKYEQ